MTLSLKLSGSPRPRLGAQRNESRPSRGHQARAVAEVVGLPLLPWQQHALDVGLEEEDGHWAYPDVAVAVARQNGKTGGVLHPRVLTGLLLWGNGFCIPLKTGSCPARASSKSPASSKRSSPAG